VAVKAPLETAMEVGTPFDAEPSERLPSVPMLPTAVLVVTHGATDGAVAPLSPKVAVTDPPELLITTRAKSPVDGFL